MSGRISPRSGRAFRTPENFFSSTSTQSGNPTWPRICRAAWTRTCFCAFSRSVRRHRTALVGGMLTTAPFTVTPLWLTSWRASLRVAAKPMR